MIEPSLPSTGQLERRPPPWTQFLQKILPQPRIEPPMVQAPAVPQQKTYLQTTVLEAFLQRFPWLLMLMLVQSISGYVVEQFETLIQQHVILASFLTMLVGGGGNSSGQTVAELVKRLGMGDIEPRQLPRVLLREVLVGLCLAVGLGLATFPRVRLLSKRATDLDAMACCKPETTSRAPGDAPAHPAVRDRAFPSAHRLLRCPTCSSS